MTLPKRAPTFGTVPEERGATTPSLIGTLLKCLPVIDLKCLIEQLPASMTRKATGCELGIERARTSAFEFIFPDNCQTTPIFAGLGDT